MNQPLHNSRSHGAGRELVVSGDGAPPRNQLAQLAASFQPDQVRNLLAEVIHTGDPHVIQVSAALANNEVLDHVLGGTAAYRHALPGVTPCSDFNALSVGTSIEASAALARLTAGFYEARTRLAQNYDEQNTDLMIAFETVNAAYALVISTSHKLFDNDDPSFRERLRPEFLKLLRTDPYLEKLVPSFQDLHVATSKQATRIALRTFFENFCENAVEPYVYSKDFSSLIQSILLRELRHVIIEESKLPVKQRTLAPYLARLFEQRMRSELETARNKDGKQQPVLDSLRDCPGEAKHLMRSITNFLVESLGDDDEGIILEHQDLISCEVMLSIGCLLPETELTQLLGTRLRQVEDLNPSLILVFASALKFSLYVEQATVPGMSYAMIEPQALVNLGLSIATRISDNERQRLVAEVFLPLADDFIKLTSVELNKWSDLPADIRELCVNNVLIQKVLEVEQYESDQQTSNIHILSPGLSELLTAHLSKGGALETIGLRWLVKQGAAGILNELQTKQVVHATLSEGDEAASLGVDHEVYQQLLDRGGFETLRILASRDGFEDRLSRQLTTYQPNNAVEAQVMQDAFVTRLIDPLRRALQEYNILVTARRASEVASMQADDNLKDLAQVQLDLARLNTQIPLCRGALEEIADFVVLEMAYQQKVSEIRSKEAKLAAVEKLSTKELVKMDKVGVPESLRKSIQTLEGERDKLLARQFKLPREALEQLPELGRSSMSLGELMGMESQQRVCSNKVSKGQGEFSSAIRQVQGSLEGMAKRRKEIHRLFVLVQRAAESAVVKSMDPESFKLTNSGSDDPLSMFCRVNLAVQLNVGKTIESGQASRLELEADVQRSLKAAFRDPFSKDDSKLVLNALADLVERQGQLLLNWNKGDDSLPEFLKHKLLEDISNEALAWLTHDIGWDESMHAPILRLYSAMLESKIVTREAKLQALPPTFTAVRYWVAREKSIRKIEQEEYNQSSEDHRDLPVRYLTTDDLYRPWTALLSLSGGRPKGQDDKIVDITTFLLEDALLKVPTANHSQLKTIWLPFVAALQYCQRTTGSVLEELPEVAVHFIGRVKERVSELSEKIRQRKEAIISEAPPVPTAEGVAFKDLEVPGGLSLPAPRQQPVKQYLLEQKDE